MPRKKTKKIYKNPKDSNKIQELDGRKLGDFIYCYRYPDRLIARGHIVGLFDTKKDKFVDIIDEITGQFRTTLMADIIDAPTRKHISMANSQLTRNVKSAERIAEKKRLKKKSK